MIEHVLDVHPASRSVFARLAAHGFRVQGTDLGTSALVREAPDGFLETIHTDEHIAPCYAYFRVRVTDVPPNAASHTTAQRYTVRECLAALDHPSTEYVLLSQRLENGLHREGAKA